MSSPRWLRVASESLVLFNKDGRLRGNGGVDRVAVMPLLNGRGARPRSIWKVRTKTALQRY
jgi:hypothetical protein